MVVFPVVDRKPLRRHDPAVRPEKKSPCKNLYLPIAYNLKDRDVLVIGAGRVAARKLLSLTGRGARLSVIAPEVSPAIARLAKRRRIPIQKRRFRAADLRGRDLVFIMTDDPALNARIATLCGRRRIPFNSATGEKQGFLMMSFVARGDLKIAVSTGGAVPFLTRAIRRHLEKIFASDWGKRLERLERLRFGLLKRGDTAGLARLSRLKFADLRRY